MSTNERSQAFAGFAVTSFGTLASRLLGLVRDMATASLLGISSGGVMDAFVVAFRLPNLARRLFGEGALAASYLPVLSRELDRDSRRAWQLASVVLVGLTVVLGLLVVAAELAIGGLAWLWGGEPRVGLLLGLSAVMLPYLVFICLAAQVSATLHAVGCFSLPALVPTVLNISWLLGVWLLAPMLARTPERQAYILALSVLAAGVLQLLVQLPTLRRQGFRFDWNWPASRAALGDVLRGLGPTTLGLAATQVNALLDSLLAWGLAAPHDTSATIPWLAGFVCYPFRQGAAAAIYFGERLYQFPLGILGLAVATSIFPVLSRHAACGAHRELGRDLSAGLRLVIFLGLPASAGLALLATPLATLFFQHGAVGQDDALRVARVIFGYALGVCAFCAIPVLVRGYYALGNPTIPLRIALVAVLLNLGLNLLLIWPLAEAGLAVSTSLAAVFQVVALTACLGRHGIPLPGREIARTAGQTALATALMLAAGFWTLTILPPLGSLAGPLARVVFPFAVGVCVFLIAARIMRTEELGLLLASLGGRFGSRKNRPHIWPIIDREKQVAG